MKTNELIKKRRKELKLTLKDIASACNVSEATASRWESGEISNMGRQRIKQLADILQISPATLVGDIDDEQIYKSAQVDFIVVPLYASVSCGTGSFVEDDVLQNIAVPSEGLSKSAEYFAQYAEGESMKDAGISDGDLLVFEKTSSPSNGMIGCFCVDFNTAVCKQYRTTSTGIVLMPRNSEFDPIPIDPQINHFVCLGKLKKVIKSY